MMRIGQGEDMHRIDDSRTLVLGGVIIEEGPGLSGHSDADVLLHAITDAILGALALGDIGQHFPPSNAAYRDADSADFLRHAMSLARATGWQLANIDSTVRTEQPKLRPYIDVIRGRIAAICGIDTGLVSVKAKTSEGLDAVGRVEAMFATAVVLLTKP
ncbi:MAG: 2-C-methyl-D-erythritol 2,4-cyclodiphosphate synthase [Dehalococcoidia bacterium]